MDIDKADPSKDYWPPEEAEERVRKAQADLKHGLQSLASCGEWLMYVQGYDDESKRLYELFSALSAFQERLVPYAEKQEQIYELLLTSRPSQTNE